ncbi:hypothetical protein GCM10027212_29550 [Actinotalea caeni]
MLAREQRDDAVGLPELAGAQHDRLVPVEPHRPIVPRPGVRRRQTRHVTATTRTCGPGEPVLAEVRLHQHRRRAEELDSSRWPLVLPPSTIPIHTRQREADHFLDFARQCGAIR